MNKISFDTIIRFFKDECSEEERLRIIEWVNESKGHSDLFFAWEELYHLGRYTYWDNPAALASAEKKLFGRIDEEKGKAQLFTAINKWVRYAAVVTAILAVAGLSLWYTTANSQEKWLTVSTVKGETREVVLPDSSKVWLNENSVLKYPRHFADDERQLNLDGEAYFEVTKDKHKPFTVYGTAMNVEVLGTKFNFKNTSGCRIAETSLIEGEVKVRGNHNEGSIVLSPGQKIELNIQTRQMKVLEANTTLDAIWHNNLVPLKNADIFGIAEILEKVYGTKIILSPDINRNETYSGVLKKKDSVEDVLKILQNTIHLQYKIHQGTIFISSK